MSCFLANRSRPSVFEFPFLFSVSCKSCVCHSYENSRVCTNNSHSGTHSPDHNYHRSSFFSCACELPILQPLCFDGLESNGGYPPPFHLRHSYVQTCGRFNLFSLSPYVLTSLLRLRI